VKKLKWGGRVDMDSQVMKILENEECAREILKMESAEEVKNFFKERGVEITEEDILSMKSWKLDSEDLSEVSGGITARKVGEAIKMLLKLF
jgi:hypothetical protein